MDILRRIRNFFSTDVAVYLSSESPFFVTEESTVAGGAISRVTDDDDGMRVVFHGAGINSGSYVVLEDACGTRTKITRGRFGRMNVTWSDGGVRPIQVVRLNLGVGKAGYFKDAYGHLAIVRRIRHRDLRLFRP